MQRERASRLKGVEVIETLTLAWLLQEEEDLRPVIRALISGCFATNSAYRRSRSWQGFDADFSRALVAVGFPGAHTA